MPANYSANRTTVDGVETVRLLDTTHKIEVSICPEIGNIAYDMQVNGQPILLRPPGPQSNGSRSSRRPASRF